MDNLTIIDKIIAAITTDSVKRLLYPDMKKAFIALFRDTQKEYGFMKIMPDPRALKDLEQRAIILSQSTTDRLKGNLRYELLEGMQAGEGADTISQRLKDVFEGDEVNTERIARNEILISSKNGRLEAYKAAGAWGRQWITVKGSRTCDLCKRMDGQIAKMGEDFVDKKTGQRFPICHAHIQCRCSDRAVMDEPE